MDDLRPRVEEIKQTIRIMIKNPVSAAGMVIVSILLVIALVSPFIAPYDPTSIVLEGRLAAPSFAHYFGTDNFGRDVFSRTLFGSRVSMMVSAVVVFTSMLGGVLVGVLAGYGSTLLDSIVMRITDVFMAFPSFLLALVVVSVLGRGTLNLVIAMVVVWWPIYARLTRAQVLVAKEKLITEAEKALGASSARIVFRHILPNCLTPIIVQATMDFGYVILSATGLSFLGLGVQPPTPEWGSMVADGRLYYQTAWWMATFPGFAIIAAVLGFNLLGDGLRDAFDPKIHKR